MAINACALVARRVGKRNLVILGTDLSAWLEGLPNWRSDFEATQNASAFPKVDAWLAANPDWEKAPAADLVRAGMSKSELKSLFGLLADA